MSYGLIILMSIIPLILSTSIIKNSDSSQWLNLDDCLVIRGFASVQIIIFHTWFYLFDSFFKQYLANLYKFPLPFWVGYFFFLSGYGLMSNYLNRGEKYINGFIKKRVLGLLFPYEIINLIYIIRRWVLIRNIEIKYFLTSLIYNFDNSYGWFVVELIVLYLLFYFCMHFRLKPKQVCVAILISVIICISILVVLYFETKWYVYTLCFPLGLITRLNRDKVYCLIRKYGFLLFVPLLLLSLYCVYTTMIEKLTIIQICYIVFAIIFVLFVISIQTRFRFESKIYRLIGKISFETYLMQAFFISSIPMELYNPLKIVLVCICSVISGIVLHKINEKILNKCL